MNLEKNTINCPNCGEQLDVNRILYQQVDDQLKKHYIDQLAKEKEQFSYKEKELADRRQKLDALALNNKKIIEDEVNEKLKRREFELKKKVNEQVKQEQSQAIDLLQEELKDKSEKIQHLNKTSVQLERLKREKDELEITIKAQTEKKFNQRLSEMTQKIKNEEKSQSELKIIELQKQLEDQKKLTQLMKQKQEQGSMQIQGEVQELALENWLGDHFPLDTIEEIKKGVHGGDCLQIVNTRTRSNCGSIYYESKRTKTFGSTWIEKFKHDIREKNANIGVLVTEVMPADMARFGLKEGVWVCTFDEFKGLAHVLRESIIQINSAIVTQENKGDKMGMLYDYLTSNEFKLQIQSIVEGFVQMKSDLESEQRSMRSLWKKREKQITKVLDSTIDMYGSIKGIAGNAVKSIPELELNPDES